MEPARRHRRALELLELVGLDPSFVDRRPSQLSGGQQQRVGLARALAADPDIVLMDEPLGAVDPLLRPQLQKELKRLQMQLGKTFVVVTHDLGEALTLADRLVVMKAGRVVQEGLPAEILLQPASDFVREFFQDIRGVPVLRLLTLGDIVEPTRLPEARSSVVHAETRVLTLLETCVATGRPESDGFTVISEAGAVLGSISIRSLLAHVAAALTGSGRS
jgi:ABC-type proline/glycine betaine transport system ATPase subunit